ncbi:MAG: hypothetical protein NTZ48_06665, partial [Candidatus Omnitrophica bacterium]|nr:hypothetical protein [Candidatus Omnitrophota bacterium]
KIDDLNNPDRLNALVSDTEALRSVLGLIETAQPIEVMEGGIRGIGLGGRQLIQLRVELIKLSRENGTNVEDVMAKQMIVFHINSEAEETMKKDLLEHDFYGFNPENIVIIVQPVLPGYDINAEGKPVKRGDSESFPYGHGYATEQLISTGDAYTLDRAGGKTVLQGSALDYVIGKGAQLMGTHRINDLTRYVNNKDIPEGSNISALDLDKLALSLYLIEQQGSNVVVELVSNPDDQKGGLFLKDGDTGKQFLLETINAQTAELQARLKNTLVGIPYNAFRLVYNLKQLSSLLSRQLPNTIRIRGKTNSIYPEIVTGDITQFADANSMGIQNVGELIHDFKTPGNLQEGIEYIRHQDLDQDFREIARQLGFTVP